jgi:hypothetical protein
MAVDRNQLTGKSLGDVGAGRPHLDDRFRSEETDGLFRQAGELAGNRLEVKAIDRWTTGAKTRRFTVRPPRTN